MPPITDVPERVYDEYRALHRRIVGTSVFLLVLLVVAVWLKILTPPFAHILFAVIFVVDFGAQCYLISKSGVYWIGRTRYLKGVIARIVAVAYGFMALVCLAFAIYSINLYYV